MDLIDFKLKQFSLDLSSLNRIESFSAPHGGRNLSNLHKSNKIKCYHSFKIS